MKRKSCPHTKILARAPSGHAGRVSAAFCMQGEKKPAEMLACVCRLNEIIQEDKKKNSRCCLSSA